MGKYDYRLTSSLTIIDGKELTTYGIEGNGVEFKDVSVDKNKVLEMLNRLNTEQLEPSHFMYFIEDELI